MFKKIIYGIISAAIIIAGVNAMNKLRYIERSTRVFKTNNLQDFRREGFKRGARDGREFRARPEGERSNFRNLPDSVRQRMITERQLRAFPDSTRISRSREFPDGKDFRESRGGHRDFRRGRSIQLGEVGWFLAVYAGFTVVTINNNSFIKLLRKRKKLPK
jgi:hypothetical protein